MAAGTVTTVAAAAGTTGPDGGPVPGGWNGGWEPNGGFCLGPFCV
ncbi:hypothetical protein [Mycobacterium sp. AT1]|nr:hypothetical protein [Mycobacterium sp. AT1]